MGRPRKWESDAERKRAAREQPTREPDTTSIGPASVTAESAPPDAPVVPREAASGAERVYSSKLTEDDYVRHQLLQTEAYAQSFRSPEKSSKLALQERMIRAEQYARWRFQAWERGEVFSL